MWYDSGCRRCVAGPDDHKRMREFLASFDLVPIRRDTLEEFVFGDGQVDTARVAWIYPVFMDGKVVAAIDIAECTVPCPTLFSLNMAKKWKVLADHATGILHIREFKKSCPFKDGTPYIDIFDMTPENISYNDTVDFQMSSSRS